MAISSTDMLDGSTSVGGITAISLLQRKSDFGSGVQHCLRLCEVSLKAAWLKKVSRSGLHFGWLLTQGRGEPSVTQAVSEGLKSPLQEDLIGSGKTCIGLETMRLAEVAGQCGRVAMIRRPELDMIGASALPGQRSTAPIVKRRSTNNRIERRIVGGAAAKKNAKSD